MTQEEAIKIAESCKVIVGDVLDSPSLHVILTNEARLVNMGVNRVINALRTGGEWLHAKAVWDWLNEMMGEDDDPH